MPERRGWNGRACRDDECLMARALVPLCTARGRGQTLVTVTEKRPDDARSRFLRELGGMATTLGETPQHV